MTDAPYDIPPEPSATDTEAGKKAVAAKEKYFSELGRFIATFAIAETNLFGLLGALSGIHIEVAKVLVGDAGLSVSLGKISKILAARKKFASTADASTFEDNLTKYVNYFTNQLRAITEIRNLVAHYGIIGPQSDEPMASNKLRASRPTEVKVSIEDLRAMGADLYESIVVMNAIIWSLDHRTGRVGPVTGRFAKLLEAGPIWKYQSPLRMGKSQAQPKMAAMPPAGSDQ